METSVATKIARDGEHAMEKGEKDHGIEITTGIRSTG
jgi:hypothetical protein